MTFVNIFYHTEKKRLTFFKLVATKKKKNGPNYSRVMLQGEGSKGCRRLQYPELPFPFSASLNLLENITLGKPLPASLPE